MGIADTLALGLQPEHVVHHADCSLGAARHGFDGIVRLCVPSQRVAQHDATQLQAAKETMFGRQASGGELV